MQKTGIKQLDEAQMLLFKEYKESGIQFLLVGYKDEKVLGAATCGKPLNVGAALALMAYQDDRFETILNIAQEGLQFMKNRHKMKKEE